MINTLSMRLTAHGGVKATLKNGLNQRNLEKRTKILAIIETCI